jgi:hypothetical protein
MGGAEILKAAPKGKSLTQLVICDLNYLNDLDVRYISKLANFNKTKAKYEKDV